MQTERRIFFTPITAALCVALVGALVALVIWKTRTPIDERALRSQLSELGVIATLDTNGRSIGSVNIASISDKTRLNEAMEIVLQLRRVSSLSLNGMSVTNVDLARIGQLTTLISLSLSDCEVGGAGYTQMSRLSNLQYLHLSGTHTTDADLESLAKLKSLVSIDLSRTKVNSDLSPLTDLPRLKWLLLARDTLNDGALASLSGAPVLTRVTLTGSEFIPSDLKALQSAKPSVTFD